MTPEETICQWMEPKPANDSSMESDEYGWYASPGGWWAQDRCSVQHTEIQPSSLTLDRLWEVEELLNDYQRTSYMNILYYTPGAPENTPNGWRYLHAGLEHKIKALAAAIQEGKR